MFDCLEDTDEQFGSPSYRDVVLANPEMDVTKGMKSVGVIWPDRRTPEQAGD